MGYIDFYVYIDFYLELIKIVREYEWLKIYVIFVIYLLEIFLKIWYEYDNYKYVRLGVGFYLDMVGEYDFDKNVFERGL